MNKSAILFATIVLGAVIAILVVLAGPGGDVDRNNQLERPAASAEEPAKDIQACDILSADIAKQFLGPDSVNVPKSSSETDIISENSCMYESSDRMLSLTVRQPLNDDGIDANTVLFGSQKPSSAVAVTGLDGQAYWDSQLAQLNILKDDSKLYVLTFGPSDPADRTQKDAENFAQAVYSKL